MLKNDKKIVQIIEYVKMSVSSPKHSHNTRLILDLTKTCFSNWVLYMYIRFSWKCQKHIFRIFAGRDVQLCDMGTEWWSVLLYGFSFL